MINTINVTGSFETSKFPAGELNITLNHEDTVGKECYFVVKNFEALDVMNIAQRVDILKRRGVDKVSGYIPYLPYSRQDRYTTENSSFALKQYAKLLNSLDLYRVYTLEAHSDVAGVIDNLIDLPIIDFVAHDVLMTMDKPNILSPDAGATKKIYKLLQGINPVMFGEVYTATKVRDLETGDITGVEVPEIPNNAPVLIIDDICDGGRTFTELAKRLPDVEKYLYVTHGIFSKPDVFNDFDKVFTTNSCFQQFKSDNLTVLEI